jgi:hypothetical protein
LNNYHIYYVFMKFDTDDDGWHPTNGR